MKTYSSKRRFRLWDYSISHKALLLRSPGSAEAPHNIDIIFSGVEFMSGPLTLASVDSVKVGEPAGGQFDGVPSHAARKLKVFTIKSGDFQYVVAAVGATVIQNDLASVESSLDKLTSTDVANGWTVIERLG